MPNALSLPLLLAAVLALAAPAAAEGKRKPPPPPPDSAADCTFVAFADVPDYLVVSSIVAGVRCDTAKQTISVHGDFSRDGVVFPVLPLVDGTLTCTNTSQCLIVYDLFSLDTTPVAYPGDNVYCATGTGVVGGTTLGPGTACEADPRL
jgi:hypothetical protein